MFCLPAFGSLTEIWSIDRFVFVEGLRPIKFIEEALFARLCDPVFVSDVCNESATSILLEFGMSSKIQSDGRRSK